MSEAKKYADFLASIQASCSPTLWTEGIALARGGSVFSDSRSEEPECSWSFRVQTKDRPLSYQVRFWPDQEDWFCDCRKPSCAHLASVVVFLKTQWNQGKNPWEGRNEHRLQYHCFRINHKLGLERVWGSKKGNLEKLQGSLVSFMGGIHSGRIASEEIFLVKSEDYQIDGLLESSEIPSSLWPKLFEILGSTASFFLDQVEVKVDAKTLAYSAKIIQEEAGLRLQGVEQMIQGEVFSNGVIFFEGKLQPVFFPELSSQERSILSGQGTLYEGAHMKTLILQILPELQKKMQVAILADLPIYEKEKPSIVLQLRFCPPESLEVIPCWKGELSDPSSEGFWKRKLQQELQLGLGQRLMLRGQEAVAFLIKAKAWKQEGASGIFEDKGTLNPSLQYTEEGLNIAFHTEEGQADPQRVFEAWQNQQQYVPLLGGGWGRLPEDWMQKYATNIQALWEAQKQGASPSCLMPTLRNLYETQEQALPEKLKPWPDVFPDIALPEDLQVKLRSYQKEGVNWLGFLRDQKVGAMLADDMGLGKTLQALCVLQGKSLILAPTSVLFSWLEQIQKFRPHLPCQLYWGPQRVLNPDTFSKNQVILSSYGTLRVDQKALNSFHWDTIVLDEAQVIKNPDSQITQAVHALRGNFKMILTGTPLENRLEDLWCQFHFINPGLLGSLKFFQTTTVEAMHRGDPQASERLRVQVKPFLLRRMKQEVEKDLPPKTEKILMCELSEEERDIYDALWISTRQEVLQRLEKRENPMQLFELLLRLRQVCCHAEMVPGQSIKYSSKSQLLLKILSDSIANGHRALVFSQWTLYLDRIQKELQESSIRFSRLDGKTQNRKQLIEEFQTHDGPSVMLLSLKAGGVGLTLTQADHVFMMDPWWNPAVEAQAWDRSHRIGQKRSVIVHRLIARQTIEERILELQKSKRALADTILQQEKEHETLLTGSITQEDIWQLLETF
jgi:superfamily II DNA or RNA helicase